MSNITFPIIQENNSLLPRDIALDDESVFFQNVPESMYLESEIEGVKNAILLPKIQSKNNQYKENEELVKRRKSKKSELTTAAETEIETLDTVAMGQEAYDSLTNSETYKKVSHISTQSDINGTKLSILNNTQTIDDTQILGINQSGRKKRQRTKNRGKHTLTNLNSSEMEALTVIHKENEEDLNNFSHIEVQSANSSSSFDLNNHSKELPKNITEPSIIYQNGDTNLESFNNSSVSDKELEMNSYNVSRGTSISTESLLSHECYKGKETDVSNQNIDLNTSEESQIQKSLSSLSLVEEETIERNNDNHSQADISYRSSNVLTESKDNRAKKDIAVTKEENEKPKKERAKRKTYSRGTQIMNIQKLVPNAVKENQTLNEENKNNTIQQKKLKKPRKKFTRGTQAMIPADEVTKLSENTSKVDEPRQTENKIINKEEPQNQVAGTQSKEKGPQKINRKGQKLKGNQNIQENIENSYNNLGQVNVPIIQNEINANDCEPGTSSQNKIKLTNDDITEKISTISSYESSDSIIPTSSYIINIKTDPGAPQDSNICISLPVQATSHVTNINLHVKGREDVSTKMSPSATTNDQLLSDRMIDLTSDSPKIKKEKVDDDDDLMKETKEPKKADGENRKKLTVEKKKPVPTANQKNDSNKKKQQNNRRRNTRRRSSSSSSFESSASSSTCGYSSCSACHGSGYEDESSPCYCSECFEESSSSSGDYGRRRGRYY